MRRTILAAASAALLFGAGIAGAETLTGKVLSKDSTGNILTIQTDAGQQVMLRTSDAAIRAEGADIEFDRVQVGDRVRVDADAAAVAGAPRAATSVEVVTVAGETGTDMPRAADATREPAPTGMERTELGEEGTAGTADVDAPRADDDRRMARLPDTAGPFPLIGLLGMASLAAGVALRRTRS